jgi:hypothetical protein
MQKPVLKLTWIYILHIVLDLNTINQKGLIGVRLSKIQNCNARKVKTMAFSSTNGQNISEIYSLTSFI